MCVYLCLWANSIVWHGGLWAQLHVCIKEKFLLRKCQQLMNSSPVQQGQPFTHISLCCCPFLWRSKSNFKAEHVIVPDIMGWVKGSIAKDFHISSIPDSHQQLHLLRAKWTKQKNENKTQIYVLSLFHRQTRTCLSPALFHCLSLPTKNYSCKLCSNHFTVVTSNLSRQAGRQSTWVELLRKFVYFFCQTSLNIE